MLYLRKWTRPVLVVTGLALAGPSAAVEFSSNGDVRVGFYSLHCDDRDGKEDATDELRLRLRAGVSAKFNAQ